MAFVPGFLHDVFISYACADDDSAGGLVRHFWKIFTDALRAEGLRIQSDDNPGGVDVFLDRRSLQSADDLTQQVLTSARSSAVFVAFHSTAYIASNWCQREATEFTSNYDSKRPHLNGRLFVIALGQRGSPAQSDIGLLRSRRYRRFYYVNDDGNDFPFNPQDDDRRNQDGYSLKEEAVKLAREVADTLKEMQRETPAPRVFIADTSDARRSQAEDIKNWLLQHGVLVLRASPSAGDWQEESRTLIAQADVFVDLHEPTPHPAAVAQAQIAADLKKRRVRWLPRGELTPAQVEALLAESSVYEETLEEFKKALHASLKQPTDRHKPGVAAPADSGDEVAAALILLVAAQKDEALLVQLEQKIDEIGCGRDAFLSADIIENPDTWRKDLADVLELHGPAAVVFVDGACEGAWADKRMRDLELLVSDAVPRARRALCSFPPRPKMRRYRPPKARVVQFDETELDRLKELL